MRELISWDVILPQRQQGYTSRRPQASVAIDCEETGTEYVHVPVFVGRVLAREKKTDEIHPNDKSELLELIDKTCARVAASRVAKLIERRDYSAKEVKDKLTYDGFSEGLIDSTVKKAIESGLISNNRFADAYIRGKVNAGWGMERIERELKVRGVDVQHLPGWPYEYLDPDDEYERAREAAERKHVHEPNAYAKLVRFLIGRGFSYGVSTRAARSVLDG